MTTYYVRQSDGDNRDAGTSPADAFRTIPEGLSHLSPGDKLVVLGSVHRPFVVDKTPGVAIESRGARVDGDDHFSFGILVRVDHVTIRGFDVTGIKRGAGINVDGQHHVTIEANTVHGIDGTGIYAHHADYLTIRGNDVSRCDSDRPTSAISVHQPKAVSGYFDRFARVMVEGNRVHDNTHSWDAKGKTDHFAFILDNNPYLPFAGRVVVRDNLFEDNFRGVLFNHCDRFVLRDNLARHNGPAEFEFRSSTGYVAGNTGISATGYAYREWLGTSRITYAGNHAWSDATRDRGLPPTLADAPHDAIAPCDPSWWDALRHDWILEH